MKATGKQQIFYGLAAAAVVAAAFLLFLWKGAFLPDSISWDTEQFSRNGYEVKLQDRRLCVFTQGERRWVSDWDWSVQSCRSADLDRDGCDELILLVWKRGSYGSHRPFWVTKNDRNLKQHIFIYRYEPERQDLLRPIWMSSEIPYLINGLYTDRDRVVIEKGDQTYSLWEWENFGLKLLADDLECVQVMACGDQLLHKAVIARGMRDDDYSYLYAGIRDVIGTADLASLNQETPLVSDKALVSDYPRFGSPAESAKAVASLGIDIVSTANNHALDQGMYGVDTTLSVYEDLGIVPVGTHASDDPADDPEDAVRFLDCKDIRLALLSFTYGTNGNVIPAYPHAVERLTEEDRMRTALRYARENADAVIVYAHWGTEYRLQTDEMQAYYTDLFAEEGVDVVIGTHPHVLQEYVLQRNETGHTMLVYYSLGNLISAQTREECRTGGVASFGLVRTGRGRVCILSPELLEVITEQDSVQWKERP